MRKVITVFFSTVFILLMSLPALAVDQYHFSNRDDEEFYQVGVTSVTYDGAIPGYIQSIYDFSPRPVYDSSFGATIITPDLNMEFGLGPEKPKNAPGSSAGGGAGSVYGSGITGAPASDPAASPVFHPDPPSFMSSTVPQYALTPIEDARNADGSIGTLQINRIGLTVTAYDGDSYEAMKKGVGHVASTSCWQGNIGMVGHNRGANDHFGRLKELKIGDTLTYTTKLGTKTYEVVFAGKIANNDWSYLQYTADNRLTLLTCVADHPEYRLCVQGMEKI